MKIIMTKFILAYLYEAESTAMFFPYDMIKQLV
jgi:hypothetical protein